MIYASIAAGFVLGIVAAYFVARTLWAAAVACGYLAGRNFLVKRRVLLRTTVFIDGLPLDDVGAVWIETDGFVEHERSWIAALEQWMTAAGDPPS